MRTVLAFTLLVAGICASVVPETSFETGPVATRDSRFITGPIENQIIEAIEDISQGIRNDGFDPFYMEKENFAYELPVPVIFNAAAFLEEVLLTGLSDIVVNYMNYSLLLSRLNFEIELPHIHFSSRNANGDVTVFGEKVHAASDGRVDVRRTVVLGMVRVNVGIISGLSIREVNIDFTLGRVTSNIRLAIQGINYSQQINQFISQTVPAILQDHSAEVNELIEIVLLDILNENLF